MIDVITPEEPVRKRRNSLWLFAAGSGPEVFLRARRLFLVLVGLCYLAAFLSYGTQITALIGSNGLLPAEDLAAAVHETHSGAEAWLRFPTLFLWTCSDALLEAVCATGVVLSLVLMLGFAPRVALLLLWASYLSVTVASSSFMAFQWDSLLLETGFLSIFLAPRGMRPRNRWSIPPSRAALFLLHFLLFKLMFLSGVTKLISGDDTWWGLTALNYHFWTQPLPSWISFHAHQLPDWARRLSTVAMFAAELVLPLLIFGPRQLRLIAAAGMIALQVVIAATGNFGFFNLLSIALCILLIDDRAWRRLLPLKSTEAAETVRRPLLFRAPVYAGALVLWLVSVLSMIPDLSRGTRLPHVLAATLEQAHAFRTISGYGLFRVMTTERTELVLEGSQDGRLWEEYEFRYKPGATSRPPPLVGFHMPRLDWQMWFEALQWKPYRQTQPSAWFVNLMQRLLEGEEAILSELEHNPFGERPPQYVRARAYGYRFASRTDNARKGEWWERRELGMYTPVLTLQGDQLVQAW